jgi:hypothetical protein
MTVPQVGHLPLIALRPFFIVSSTPSAISRFALHLTQYPSAIKTFTVRASCPNGASSLTKADSERNSEKEAAKAVENQAVAVREIMFVLSPHPGLAPFRRLTHGFTVGYFRTRLPALKFWAKSAAEDAAPAELWFWVARGLQ